MIAQLVGQKSGHGTIGFSAQGLNGYKQGVDQNCSSGLESQGVPPRSMVIDGIHFLVVIGLRSLLSCYRSARDHSQLLEVALKSLPHGTFHSATEHLPCIKSLSCLNVSDFFFNQPEKPVCF